MLVLWLFSYFLAKSPYLTENMLAGHSYGSYILREHVICNFSQIDVRKGTLIFLSFYHSFARSFIKLCVVSDCEQALRADKK